jgi:PAS domain S-box-containing protein
VTEENSDLFQGMDMRTTALPDHLFHYGVALLSVALALGTTLLLGSYLETTLASLFFVAVMVSAWYGGLKPGIVATVLSSFAINYFLIAPIYALSIPDLGTLVQLGVFVMAAILISSLNAAQRLAQRRAEVTFKSLRESEARFGCLAESNIIGMLVAELSGVILAANDTFLQMVGYTQEELRSGRLRWNEMTPPESLEVSERAVQELLTTGACTPFEKVYIRKDGSRVSVMHGAVMTGETSVTGFVLDLSEQKRLEAIQQEALCRERSLHAEVQAANIQLETVLASLKDQFLVLDQEWRYSYVSDRVVEFVGKSRAELLGKRIWDIFPETVGSQFYREVHRAAAKQQIVHFEYFYAPWQRWFENRVYPSAAGVSILVTDITERKRAEETLQRTNQTLQTVLDACPVAIAFFDPQGIVRVWNRAAEQIFGWSAAEAIGRFMPTVAHRRQEFLASIQTVLSGRSLNGFEAQHQHKDGHMVDLEIWANLAHDAEGNPGCLGIAWDITERKQAEALLRSSEERYRLLVATTTALVWTTNAKGQFISAQPSWEQYTGQRWEEYAGWGWLEMFHPEDREGLKARWEHALAERSYYEAEGRLWHAPSGQHRHIVACAVPLLNADGSVREWIGMDTDIHDRKQVEEILRHSEAKFQVLVSNMPGMVYRYALGADGVPTFTYVSSGSRDLVELEPETILQDADTFLRLIHPDDLPSFQNSVAIAVENSAVWQWEGRIITPSGQLKWIQGRSRPQETEYGEAWDGLLFDITDRKQAEEALRQSEERLRVALKSSPITVFNQDQELRYTWIYNPTFDYHATEVIGKQDQDLLPEEDAAILTRIKRHVLETGSGVREEVKLTMHNRDFYYDLAVEPLQTEDGETIGITCASVDITERKQMELALHQSETTLNALLASAPIGIAFFDRDLRYIHANEALAATNGIPLNEHIGRTLEDVLPQWAPAITPVLQQVMDTQEPLLNQEVVGVTYPSDQMRYGLVNYFPVCLTNGEILGVGVTSVDISDRKRIEEERKRVQQELQNTLQTLQTIVAASPLPIVVIEPDMTVQLWNAAAEQLFGWSEAEVLGQLLPLVPEEKQEECRQLREAITRGEVFSGVQTYHCKRDGSRVILNISAAPLYDDHGNVNAILLILQDITERQQAEAALRDSEERLRLALIAADQGLYDLNVQTGDAIVSPAYAQMLGYAPDEFEETNAKWRDRLHPDDVAVVYQAYEDYIAGKLETYRVEFRQRTKSGDWKWILSIGKIVTWDSEGQPLRMLGTHTDITDRKQAEAEREQLLAREKTAREGAETANRIKDEFLAVLSHELRSPLNPILGWSRLLQTQKLDEQKTRQALATIERNAKLQTQLIEDLLDVSRILRGKLVLNITPVSLINTIEAALETVRLAVEAKGIQIQRTFNLDLDQVMGDAARLQQVIWNLLTNAVKFTPSGGMVEIRLEQSNNQIQIQVKDTGKGISSDFLPYVFDYFRQEDGTTTRKFGGLGLGLAIVRHITELHGGTVWAESPGEGMGATFTVQLPLMPSPVRVDEKDEPSIIANLFGLRVLAVDDDEDIRELLEFILQQAGAEACVVASATEALQQLEVFSPKVLISDVGMPDVDGYMLIRQVRTLASERGKIPAIALTAYAGEIDQQQAIAAGFQMHLAKPVEPEQLINAIISLLKENSMG